jgi:hypothetical protein
MAQKQTTLSLSDFEAAERFRTFRDERGLSTDGALRKLMDNYD